MRYIVVESDRLPELEEKVNLFIADGWRPLGGIAVIEYLQTDSILKELDYRFFQALVKE